MNSSYYILFFLFLSLAILIAFVVHIAFFSSHKMTVRRGVIILLVCMASAAALTVDLLHYFPKLLMRQPVITPNHAPAESDPEPTAPQLAELPVMDYADILRNSEEFDGQEVRIAGRIAEASSSRVYRSQLIFRERLGFDGGGGKFEVNLRQRFSTEETASDYYHEGQYILLQGQWFHRNKYLSCDVISTGEDARQAAEALSAQWEATGRSYADTLPITDYMDIAASPKTYRGQRVRTVGRIGTLYQNDYYHCLEFSFASREDGTSCIEFDLMGCPPEMQSVCEKGQYVLLSGVVHTPQIGDPYLEDCFIESIGSEVQALAEQSEVEWRERRIAEREAFFASCQEYDYDSLARYPDEYKGEPICLKGTVIQTCLDGRDTALLLDAGEGNIVYVSYYGKKPGDPEILEGDQIVFYGECSGKCSYDAAQGERKRVPWVTAQYSSFNQFDDP